MRSVVLMDIDSEIFAEGFRDKIFDTEIIAALGHALSNKSCENVVYIFTAAVAQGVLHCFCMIHIPKYSQMAFGTRYLTLGLLSHFDVHYIINILVSVGVWSISSLLPLLKVCSVVLMDIDTEIFAEGFRDKIFDTEVVAALVHALNNTELSVHTSLIKFFTATIAQGVLCYFDKYLYQNICRRIS